MPHVRQPRQGGRVIHIILSLVTDNVCSFVPLQRNKGGVARSRWRYVRVIYIIIWGKGVEGLDG